jgi:micrococcal nuclease
VVDLFFLGLKEFSMRNRRTGLLFFFSLLCLSCLSIGLNERPTTQPSSDGKYIQKDFKGKTAYKVIRAVDGDTVVLLIDGQETKVRLVGVDTPETVHPFKPVEAYGKEASRFTTNLLKGESVYLEYDQGQGKLDRYGRTLAYLYRAPDGLFINLELVRQGYGFAYTKYPFQYMELFRFYERKARESEKGLWSPEYSAAEEKTTEAKSTASENGVMSGAAKDTQEQTVYITRSGKKYHSEGCRSLKKSKIPISLEEAKQKGYGPCSICNPAE